MTPYRLPGLVVLLLGVLVLSGCVAMPQSGPVVSAAVPRQQIEPGPTYYDPPPPQPGDTQEQVVEGFLDAMLATPAATGVARDYLTDAARQTWDPQRTITYVDASPPRGTRTVSLEVRDAHLIDGRGAWQGDLGDQTYEFGVVRENGEFRIAAPPDALIVPESWYEQRYRQVSLYFFDPTGQVLVPEPVFVPEGQQLASTLVRGLLAGPPTSTVGFALSFFPPGLTAGLSVPVSPDGVADIALSGSASDLGPDEAELLLAQLTTTLRQDPSIEGVRVSIDGQPLDLPVAETTVGLDSGEAYAPYVADSSASLFALRGGLLVTGTPQDLGPVDGPFGTSVLGVRSVVPDITATTAAAVSADGTSVLLAPVDEPGSAVQVLSGASDLLPPAWDFSGRLWLVDRTPQGARVLQRAGEVARPVDVPGVSGADVRRLLVSRDGSRLVAVVRTDAGDEVVVSRILHDDEGRVQSVTPAVRIDDATGDPADVVDISWRSPVLLTVLTRINDGLSQVRELSVDGAPGGLGTLSTTIQGELRGLAGSPAPGQVPYAEGLGALYPLTGTSSRAITTDPAVSAFSYAG